jgi:hypothetical protein
MNDPVDTMTWWTVRPDNPAVHPPVRVKTSHVARGFTQAVALMSFGVTPDVLARTGWICEYAGEDDDYPE